MMYLAFSDWSIFLVSIKYDIHIDHVFT
uniref:Uncharacterized protein n=1 Tax=Arundo donax TaxID=35708 RepID=A0A0A8Y9I0_ARUDO